MIDSWVEFCTHELEIPLCTWVFPLNGIFPEVPEATAQAKEDVRRALDVLNNHLLQNTYMVGHQVTLADICVCCALSDAMAVAFDTQFLAPLPNLMRWFNLVAGQPEFVSVLGKVKPVAEKAASGAAPAKKAEEKKAAPKKAAPEQDAKYAGQENKEKKVKEVKAAPKKVAEAKKEPSAEEKAAAEKEAKKKQLKKVIKEGGKRGVEIDGAADMGGLQFFCTSVDEPDGDLEMIGVCMDAMNEASDPTEEERKGGSARIGKMIFSAGVEQLAVLAYIPEALTDQISATEWLTTVIGEHGGVVSAKDSNAGRAVGTVPANQQKGVFPLKLKEPCISAAITYLKGKGLFPDKDDDSDDEFIFGDDDFPS